MHDQSQAASAPEKGRSGLRLKQTCAELDSIPSWRKFACTLGLARLVGMKSKAERRPDQTQPLAKNSQPLEAPRAEAPPWSEEKPKAKLTYARLESLDAYLRDKCKSECRSFPRASPLSDH